MIPTQPSVAMEIDALVRVLGVSARELRHVLRDSESTSAVEGGSTNVLTLTIPKGRALLITHVYLESYPLDAAGSPLFAERQPGGFVDDFSLNFTHKTTELNAVSQSYRNLAGNIWLPFGAGQLVISVKPDSFGTSDPTERVAITCSAFQLPQKHLEVLQSMATTRL